MSPLPLRNIHNGLTSVLQVNAHQACIPLDLPASLSFKVTDLPAAERKQLETHPRVAIHPL